VYDVTIELQRWPHLEDHAKKAMSSVLVVHDIMTQNPIVFREVESVGVLIDILRGTEHNGYPVLHCSETLTKHPRLGTLAGIVNRRHLCVLLQKRAFTKDKPEDHLRGEYDKWLPSKDRLKLSNPSQNLVTWEELEETYPRYPLPEKLVIHPADRECWLDLRPYMNRTVYTVNDTAPVVRAFRLFRTLGLRVLVVVSRHRCMFVF
jgi:chloride channel 7